jgi:hypothetical protein
MKARAAGLHEDLARQPAAATASDRSFGFVLAGALLVAGVWPLRHGNSIRAWALAVAVFFLVPALVRPRVLRPLNRLWRRLGLFLHGVANPLVMGAIFFGVLTPMGLVMRWRGWDPLRLRFEPGAPSYWIPRRPPGPRPETMNNQF